MGNVVGGQRCPYETTPATDARNDLSQLGTEGRGLCEDTVNEQQGAGTPAAHA